MPTEIIKVPDLGESGEVEVIELLVAVGQSVAENDSLLVLESDKAAMEIPAPMGGVVKSIAVNLGDQVKTGSQVLTLEVEETSATESEADKPEAKKEPASSKAKTQKQEKGKAPDKIKPAATDTESAEAIVETLKVPDLGGEGDVEVIEVHVAPGDTVNLDDTVITLESDKAAMDVPSTMAGEVKAVIAKVGDKLSMGSPILDMLVAAKTAEPEVISEPDVNLTAPVKTSEAKPARPASIASDADVYAGPAVRKLARELGANLLEVPGSGAKGRILKEDIHDFVKVRLNTPAGFSTTGAAVSQIPDQDFSKFGEVEQVSLSKIHKLTAVNMHRNWSSVPHVAQFSEADVTDLEAFREQQKAEAQNKGVKLTFLPFLLKASVKALQGYPQFNVSLHSSGEYLIQKKYFHVGVAVATDAGLVVPVIRNIDQKSLWELSAELVELTDKAKQRKLAREDMQGACFTISSLGAIGGTGFIPIINAPEVAILGVGKTAIKPVFKGDEFIPRKMLPLTLSYDHRAVNGVDGGLFSTYLVKLLSDIRLLLL
ncbi:MAG: dihydrolipoyllysine-residue acetyltransferase [Gammaproteobacteria bacterium]|nr:dihydrolipoyllysine-residue acetyltransferase [Gammaproteobacteria bacterium]